jgi:hypothetical protein
MEYGNINQNQIHPEKRTPQRKDFEAVAIRILAVVGLIAVMGVGLWGSATLVRSAPEFMSGVRSAISTAAVYLSSIFQPAENLKLSIYPQTLRNGEMFSIGWTHSGKTSEGVYQFSYKCLDGVQISITNPDGTKSNIQCETPMGLKDEKTSPRYRITSDKNRFLDAPITISFIQEEGGEVLLSDTMFLTVINENIAQSSTTESSTTYEQNNTEDNAHVASTATNTNGSDNTVSTATEEIHQFAGGETQTEDPNGKPDLKVTILETGYIDKATNEFFATSTPLSPSLRIAVRFSVENAGTKTTPQWSFNAVLPTSPHYIYHSNGQRALAPGDKIEYTLGFDQTKAEKTVEVIVNADPTRSISELNEDNNIVKKEIELAVSSS